MVPVLIGTPVYSDVGVLYTPTLTGGSWAAGLPRTNLQAPELADVARSSSAALADTRFRVDLKADRAVRVLGVVHQSPEHVGAPSTAARVRFLGQPSSMLFDYEAGDDAIANGATFTRATTATYIDASGVLRSAASGILRDAHFVSGVRSTLLEPAATNPILWSQDISNAAWVKTNLAAPGSGISDPAGGTAANRLQSTSANANITQALAAGSSAVRTSSVWIRRVLGSGVINVLTPDAATWVPVAVTTAWQRFSVTGPAGTPRTGAIQIVTSGDAIDVYGFQLEDGTLATSYIPTTTVAVTRNADVLSFTAPSTSGTIYQKYWDLATAAFVESTLAYTGGAAIPFTTGRAYVSTRIAPGTVTQAAMQALVYDSGWFAMFPAGKTAEDTEGMNLLIPALPAAGTLVRYVSCQIDDSLNAAGFVDVARFVATGGFQPATGLADGSKFGLETATQASDGNTSVTSFVRRPTRRVVTLILPEQTDAEAMGQQLPFQFVVGIDRQFVLVWDATDTTYGYLRTFLATLKQLSEFEAVVGYRWGIPYAIREVR
jgi:hypothetical protein